MEAGNAAAAGVKAVFPDAEIVVRPAGGRRGRHGGSIDNRPEWADAWKQRW